MSLTEQQLNDLLEVAKTAALKAGEIIASKQGQTIVTNKRNY